MNGWIDDPDLKLVSCYNNRAMEPLKPLPPRNPVTTRKHRREVFWQITLPLLLGLFLIVALMVLAALQAAGSVNFSRRFADISLLWLIAPNLFLSLLNLALLVGLAAAATLLLHKLPPYARLAQDAFARLALKTGQICDRIVEPVLRGKGASTLVSSVQSVLRREVRQGVWGKTGRAGRPGPDVNQS